MHGSSFDVRMHANCFCFFGEVRMHSNVVVVLFFVFFLGGGGLEGVGGVRIHSNIRSGEIRM